MNISLLLIILLIVLLVLNFKIKFMAEDPTQMYLSQTNDIRNTISGILNDPDYRILIENVPGQKIYIISGDPPSLTPEIIKGDTSKVESLENIFPKLLGQTNELIDNLNDFIELAEDSTGVYTSEKLNAFMVYYKNMLNNITLIKNYLEK
jgi:hypothetical protein